MPPLARSTWPLIQPPSGPARKETDGGDVFRRAETLQRVHLGQAVDQFVATCR